MSTLKLVVKEIAFRRVNFLVSLLAVIVAAGFFTTFFTAAKASDREVGKLMLTMGFNLRIIPKDTNKNEFLLTGLADKTMPAEYLDKLASQKGFSYNHLLATLQKKMIWRQENVILTGLAPEICPPDRKKPPLLYQIEPGTAYLGFRLAEQFGIKKGDAIEIGGKVLTVAGCLSEKGDADDIRIQCHINDAQEILSLPGQISEIQAIDCLCFTPTDDPVAILRAELDSILPDAEVFQLKQIAAARTKMRVMVRKVFTFVMPLVIIVCAVWIGIMTMMNVRDRKYEIGVLRSLGSGSVNIAALFLCRSFIIGLLGAAAGFALGTGIALKYGPVIFTLTAKAIKPDYVLLVWTVIVAPVFAALSSFIPSMLAVVQDPADTLRER